MMTLLMVLFIVMFAISQVDSKKFMALKTGLAAGFGAPLAMLNGADALLDAGGAVAPDAPNIAGVAGNKSTSSKDQVAKSAQVCSAPDPANAINPQKVSELATAMSQASVKGEVENLKKAEAQLQKALQVAGLAKGATFRFDERGLIVSIATDKVLFDSGSATLLPQGRRILDVISPTLLKLPNRLSVDGHTNSIPISTAQFPSNWELSTDRATGVLRYLAAARHLPFSRMSATGFADTHPLLPASDPRSVVLNRRVEIVVLARVDNSAGRAVASLGNSAPIDATSGTASASASATSSASTDSTDATDSTDTESTSSTTTTATPSHNLLGPDPTPKATASPTR
jgi:chemotaxis protein MotB